MTWLLRFWLCFDRGLTGAHFGAFGDGNGGFSWNEYFNAGPTRSPLYLSDDSITVGKSIEAMREGAQDYELLKMLETEAKKHGAKDVLTELRNDVQRVMAAHTNTNWIWNSPKDRSIADQVRLKVLRSLQVLMGEQ